MDSDSGRGERDGGGVAATRRRGPIIGAIVVLLGVLILSGGATGGAEAFVGSRAFSGAGDCPPPSDRTNATLVTRWYEDVVNGQLPEAIGHIVATDVVVHVSTDGTGDEVGIVAAERWLREQLRAYPDLFVRIDALVHEGDFVRAYVTWQGTSLDKAAARGLRPAMWAGPQRFRIACGRIAEIWLVEDASANAGKAGVKGGPDEEVSLVGATLTPTPQIAKAPTKAAGGAVVTLVPYPTEVATATATKIARPTKAPAVKTPKATRTPRATATRRARATATKTPTRAARTATPRATATRPARGTATATPPRTVQATATGVGGGATATATRTAGEATRAARDATREATRNVTPTQTSRQATRAVRDATQAATQAGIQATREAREATRDATRAAGSPVAGSPVPGSPVAAGDATATACPATDADANENLVARWYEDVVNGRRPESIRAILADDVIVRSSGGAEEVGINAARRRVNEQLRAFPDLFVRVETLVAEGDLVVAYVSREGTDAVATGVAGSPVAGLPTVLAGAELFRIECGRIAEIWLATDGELASGIVVTVNEGLAGATTPEATAAP